METKLVETKNINSNGNIRGKISQDSVTELSHSIKEMGLLAPLVVQADGKKFTLIAGHRRLKAIEMLKWDKVSVITYPESEKLNIKAIQLVENIQREGLDIFVEAKAFRNAMLEHKLPYKDIAILTGKSIKYIVGRDKLNDLIGIYKEKVKSGELKLAPAMIISRLSKLQQKDFNEYFGDTEFLDTSDVHSWINQNVMSSLKFAPFPVKSTESFYKGVHNVACINCNYNTANNSLFPEIDSKDSRCSDPECYQHKLNAYFVVTTEKMKKSGTEFICISSAYGDDEKQNSFARDRGTVRVNKSDYRKYAKNSGVKKYVGLFMDGPDIGKVVDVALESDIELKKTQKDSKKANTVATDDKPTPKGERGSDGKTVDDRFHRRIFLTKVNENQEVFAETVKQAMKKRFTYNINIVIQTDLDLLYKHIIHKTDYNDRHNLEFYTGKKISTAYSANDSTVVKSILGDCETSSEKFVRIMIVSLVSHFDKDAEHTYANAWLKPFMNYAEEIDVDIKSIREKVKPEYEKKRKRYTELFVSKHKRKPGKE